jgi:uncharacterized membrane protein HdeD (DUF308 family)
LPAAVTAALLDERASWHRRWWLFLGLGLVAIIIGLLAISFPFMASIAKVLILGVLLLTAGIAEVIHAILVRNLKGFAIHLLAAALYLIVGLFMLEDPIRAATVLTLLLAASFLVGGVLRIIFSVGGDFPNAPWVLLNGAVDILLGALIWSGWPESSLEFLGLFVGIDLLFHGWSWVMLGLTVRSYTETLAPQTNDAVNRVAGTGAEQARG